MPWDNAPIRLFHGTDAASADAIGQGGVDLRCCQPLTDFGIGFYTTTNLVEAKSWANLRTEPLKVRKVSGARAVVIGFTVPRDTLAALRNLSFVRDEADYWDFVFYNRNGFPTHGKDGPSYDVVCGPVAVPDARRTVPDWDQYSFHTIASLKVLGSPDRMAARADIDGVLF